MAKMIVILVMFSTSNLMALTQEHLKYTSIMFKCLSQKQKIKGKSFTRIDILNLLGAQFLTLNSRVSKADGVETMIYDFGKRQGVGSVSVAQMRALLSRPVIQAADAGHIKVACEDIVINTDN